MPQRRYDVQAKSLVLTEENVDGACPTFGVQTQFGVAPYDFPHKVGGGDTSVWLPQGDISNMEFCHSIQLLTLIVVSLSHQSSLVSVQTQLKIGRDRTRAPNIQSRVGVDKVKVVTRGNSVRKGAGENLVLVPWLDPLTIGHSVDVTFRVVVVPGFKVPNISLMRTNQLLLILLFIFVIKLSQILF